MADIKRPDTQVLEDRVRRLKTQIEEYRGLRTYESTRKRLRAVKSEIEECAILLDEVLRSLDAAVENAQPAYHPTVILKEPEEFTAKKEFEDDLSDIFSISIPDPNEGVESYSSKDIMIAYHNRIEQCSEASTGILQVNQVCGLIHSWFETRYSPSATNSRFKYKAQRIHEWIDLIILAAGEALHTKTFPCFKQSFNEWIDTIGTESDLNWILPKEVMQFQKEGPSRSTKEAVMIERIVKQMLYGSDFYPSLIDSIQKIVIKSGRFKEEDLTTSKILEDCKGSWLVTSSFDATKY